MVNVFISHSRKDKELIRAIDDIFRSVDVTPLFMEFTPESKPPYKKIEENVTKSNAVFLFLTENVISSEYTKNWISFEGGLAKKANKELFVVEDVNNRIHFPVSYVTDYILYEPTEIGDWRTIQKILQNIKQIIENNKLIVGLTIGGAILGGLDTKKIDGAFVGGFAGLILGGILTSLDRAAGADSIKVKCPQCGIEFNFYSRFGSFPCPSCRIELKFFG